MKFSGKMCLMIILKVTKNQGFTLCLEDIIFEKPQGVSNWPLPPLPPTLPAVLGLKRGALDVDLEYPKELRELHNDYPLAPDKTEIKRDMLSEYRLKIADLYNIPIGNVRNELLTFLIKENM